jgi:hypothetical protein
LRHVQIPPFGGLAFAPVFAVTGACCMIRREVFDAVAGFDMAFVNGGEDVDLCQKVKSKGMHVFVAYGSVVQHHVSLSRSGADAQNERNSRLLYVRWRAEFKTELARVWLGRLQTALQSPQIEAMDEKFTPAMVATPQTLALVLAESVLQQEECYWERTLDDVDGNSNLAERCQIRGLRFCHEQEANLIEHAAELHVTDVRSLRNFFVCGQVHGGLATTLTLSVNGIQEESFTLEHGANINVGIIAPVCLPGITNRFCVSVSAPVKFSHFVLDDQMII